MASTLSDVANWAQILSVPLALLAWLVTAGRFAKFWKRWFKLVFSIATALGCWTLFRHGWFDWLAKLIEVPVWLVALLFASGFAITWVGRAFTRRMASAIQRPTSDQIDGIEWHWQYRGNQIDELSFSAFCPNSACRCRLEPQRTSGYAAIDDIALVCGRCGFQRQFDCNWGRLVHNTALEIERRFRIGEYPKLFSSQ